MESNIELKIDSGIAIVKINSPKTLNALNSSVMDELGDVFNKLEKKENIYAVIITGEGRAFVAGADIQEMSGFDETEGYRFGKNGAKVFRTIEKFRLPVIAAINGFALGGGCELAMACDIRLASTKAKLGQPEVGLGITPGFSGTQRLARLVGEGRAKELIFTGSIIDAQEGYRIGLVNKIFEPDVLLDEAIKMAKIISGNSSIAVQYSKEVINIGLDLDIDSAIALENDYFAKCFDEEDQKKGMTAFLNKEKPKFNS